MKLLMALDKYIFTPNQHMDSNVSHYKYLVDISKYRDKEITGELKTILYRPQRMKKLYECYWKIAGPNEQIVVKKHWDDYYRDKDIYVPVYLNHEKE